LLARYRRRDKLSSGRAQRRSRATPRSGVDVTEEVGSRLVLVNVGGVAAPTGLMAEILRELRFLTP
jgi:hypothetical protein